MPEEGIRPVLEAFSKGRIVSADEIALPVPPCDPAGVPWLWGGLVLLAAVLLVANLRNYYNIIPFLADCAWRWRGNFIIEDSIPRKRDRDLCAAVMVLPMALVIWRFQIVPLLLPAAWFLLRLLIFLPLRPSRRHRQEFLTARRCFMNYFILAGILVLAVVGICTLLDVSGHLSKWLVISILSAFYLLFFVRKAQILSSFFRDYLVFLYLCALEIVPTGLLVTASLIL